MGMAQPRESIIRKKRRVRSIEVQSSPGMYRRVVRNKKSRAPRLLLSSLFVFAFCLSGLLLIRYTQITQLNNHITQIKSDISELKATRDVLVSELEPYKSTRRIERLARTHLGMTYPTQERIIRVDFGESSQKDGKDSKYAIIDEIRSFLSVGYHGE